MARVLKTDAITGEILLELPVPSELDGWDMAVEILLNHLVEFDTISFIEKEGSRIYTIKHLDDTYAPVEVLVEK